MAVCTGPSESKIDQLSKMMASGVSRRDALKWVGASAIGAMLVSVGVKQAEARARCDNPGVCGTYQNCSNSSTCFCGTTTRAGRGFCFEDAFCSQLIDCTTNAQCKAALGRGHKCLVQSCCTRNVCIAKCGSGASSSGSGARAGG